MLDRRLALALAPDPSTTTTDDDAHAQSNRTPSQISQSNQRGQLSQSNHRDPPPPVAMISTWKLSMFYNALVKLRATKDHLTHTAQTSLARLTRRALAPQSNPLAPSQSQSNHPSQTNDARAVSNVLYFVAKLRWPVLTQALRMSEPHDRQELTQWDKDRDRKSNNTEGGACIVTRALVSLNLGRSDDDCLS